MCKPESKKAVTTAVADPAEVSAAATPAAKARPLYQTDPYSLVPWPTAIATYLAFFFLFVVSHLSDLLWKLFSKKDDGTSEGYAPILSDQESFWNRRLYYRIVDCWNRPICSAAGAWIDVVSREFDGPLDASMSGQQLKETGKTQRCLNLGSYNYLGFGVGGCDQGVLDAMEQHSISTSSSRIEQGTTKLHQQLEDEVARFVDKEDAIVVGQGFATNSLVIPALVGKGALIISDELNHKSIVDGARGSGARVRVFHHNSPTDLERVLRQSIMNGQPRTHKPWTKILILVEGLYSMEGTICQLAEIVAIKKKYKAYLWVDEAHSIGALGKTGRGVTEHCGVDRADVDILMGTFTKSFGSVGGYIASSKAVVDAIRARSTASFYAASLSPSAAQQATYALQTIDRTELGKEKIARLAANAKMFRARLMEMGATVYGDEGSPVIPMMLYHPCKIAAFSRECLKYNLAVVVVGVPATPLLLSRARFCMSAAHKTEDLEYALDCIGKVLKTLMLDYGRN